MAARATEESRFLGSEGPRNDRIFDFVFKLEAKS